MDITEDNDAYFQELEEELGIPLDQEFKNWYAVTERDQGDEMTQEYPNTPEEAFRKKVKGAIFRKTGASV